MPTAGRWRTTATSTAAASTISVTVTAIAAPVAPSVGINTPHSPRLAASATTLAISMARWRCSDSSTNPPATITKVAASATLRIRSSAMLGSEPSPARSRMIGSAARKIPSAAHAPITSAISTSRVAA